MGADCSMLRVIEREAGENRLDCSAPCLWTHSLLMSGGVGGNYGGVSLLVALMEDERWGTLQLVPRAIKEVTI